MHFSNESLRNNALAYLTPPEGLYVRVLSLHHGEVVIQAYASVVQPLSVLEVINILKALPDGYLVMVTTLVRGNHALIPNISCIQLTYTVLIKRKSCINTKHYLYSIDVYCVNHER